MQLSALIADKYVNFAVSVAIRPSSAAEARAAPGIVPG